MVYVVCADIAVVRRSSGVGCQNTRPMEVSLV